MRSISGIVETSIAVHEEQEHVSVSQVGAGRYPFSAIDAVLVSERQLPRRVIAHEVEHSCCQLVMVDSRGPLRGDGMDCPRFGAIHEELMPVALLPLQPVVDRAGRNRRGQGSEIFGRRAGYTSELLEAPVRERRDLPTARVTQVRRQLALLLDLVRLDYPFFGPFATNDLTNGQNKTCDALAKQKVAKHYGTMFRYFRAQYVLKKLDEFAQTFPVTTAQSKGRRFRQPQGSRRILPSKLAEVTQVEEGAEQDPEIQAILDLNLILWTHTPKFSSRKPSRPDREITRP